MVLLSMIGMGTANEKSMSIAGMERLREADVIFAEFFTSTLEEGSIERLQKFLDRRIELLDREMLEEEVRVVDALRRNDVVCLLTAGDPLAATTHQEIRMDALDMGAEVEIIHSASIFTVAAGTCGLQQYKFGRTTTIPYPDENYFPTSPVKVISRNLSMGLHTLILLDIQEGEGRYMTAGEACGIILQMAGKEDLESIGIGTMTAAVARAGRKDWSVAYGELGRLTDHDIGETPHCLIIPGKLHFAEEEMLEMFRF